MTSFMTEQLEKDTERNELVQEGMLSQAEADEQAEEWATVRVSICVSECLCVGVGASF